MSDRISIVYDANVDDLKARLEEMIKKNKELADAANTAQKAMSGLGSSVSATNNAFNQSTTVINNYNNSVNTTNNSINQMNNSMRQTQREVQLFEKGLQNIAGKVAAAFTVQSIVQFGASVVDTTRKVELMQNRLAFVFGSVTGGREAFERLYDVSQKLGIGFQELGDGFAGFAIAAKMAGFSAKESEGMFTKVAISLRGAGAGSLQTQRAFYALQQMLSKGVVAAEELRRQLGEALPGASDLMTKAYNRLHPAQQVTNLEFTKLLESGKIISAEILPEMANVLEETFAPAVAGKSGSLDASITRVTNSWERFKLALGEADFQNVITFTRELTETIDLLSLALTNERLNIFERIGVAAQGIFNPAAKDIITAQLYTEKLLNQQLIKQQSIVYALSGEYEKIGDATEANSIAVEMLNKKAASSQQQFNKLTLDQLEEKRESLAEELKDTEHLLGLGREGTDQLKVKGKAYQMILDRMEEIRIKNKETEKQELDAIAAAKERVALEETRLLKTTEGTAAYYTQLIKVIEARKDLVRLEKADTPKQMGLDIAKLDKDLNKAKKMISSFTPEMADIVEEGVYVPSVEALERLSKEIKDLTKQQLEDRAAAIQTEIQFHEEGTDRRLELEKALVMAKANLAAKEAEIQGKTAKEIEAIFAKANIEIAGLDKKFYDKKREEAEEYADFYKRLQDGLDGYEGNSLQRRIKAIREYYGKLKAEAFLYGRTKEEMDALDTERDKAILNEKGQTYANALSGIGGLFRELNNVQKTLNDNELNDLQKQLDNKLITEEQYEQKVAEIKKKQFQQDKQAAIAEALLNIPLAILQGFRSGGALGGAIAAIAAGAQLAAIQAAQPPAFKDGVIDLQGPGTGTSDSIPARLSRGESVMTARETAEYRPVLQAIRDGEFETFVAKRYTDSMRKQDGLGKSGDSFAENIVNAFDLQSAEIINAIGKNKRVKIDNVKELASAIFPNSIRHRATSKKLN